MNVKIGENIRKLRTEHQVTQEKLAEYLGVSAQAVSRWESETCYPDLEMLPGIASYFGVTIDSLMGYDASQQEQEQTMMRVSELTAAGRLDEARAEARRGLSLFPKNFGLAVMLASSLIVFDKGSPELDECIALCRRILRDCLAGDVAGDMIRLSAKNLLVFALTKNGDHKGAYEVAVTMPLFNQSRELNIQTALTGKDKWDYSISVLPLICTMLGSSFLNAMACADEEKPRPIWNYTVDDCRRDIAIWDAMYAEADKRDGGAAKRRCFIYMFLHFTAARRLAELGDNASALKYLKEVLRCISEGDSTATVEANLGGREEIAKNDPACAKRDDGYKGKSNAYFIYYGYIAGGCFASLEQEDGYQQLVEAIKKATQA